MALVAPSWPRDRIHGVSSVNEDDDRTTGFEPEVRDLEWAEPALPLIREFVRSYFRSDVQGLEHIPDGPSLLVANHSGGYLTPDSIVFILEYLERFGVDAPLYWLGHEALLRLPVVSDFLRRSGVLPADPAAAQAALEAGATVIVYPGGEIEMHRPFWERNTIKFLGRQGFLRLAARTGVPIVPVVSAGAHNTYLPLTDGRRLARALGLERRFNVKALPISLAAPWGLNISDLLLHVPLPAQISVRVLEPIHVGADDDLDERYEAVTTTMQRVLDEIGR